MTETADQPETAHTWRLEGSEANLSLLREEIVEAALEHVTVSEFRRVQPQEHKLHSGVAAELLVSFTSGVLSGMTIVALERLIYAAEARGNIKKTVIEDTDDNKSAD